MSEASAAGRHRHKKHASYFNERENIKTYITEHVEDYRGVCEHLDPEDFVLELGCAGGVTTSLAGQTVTLAVGNFSLSMRILLSPPDSMRSLQV